MPEYDYDVSGKIVQKVSTASRLLSLRRLSDLELVPFVGRKYFGPMSEPVKARLGFGDMDRCVVRRIDTVLEVTCLSPNILLNQTGDFGIDAVTQTAQVRLPAGIERFSIYKLEDDVFKEGYLTFILRT